MAEGNEKNKPAMARGQGQAWIVLRLLVAKCPLFQEVCIDGGHLVADSRAAVSVGHLSDDRALGAGDLPMVFQDFAELVVFA